MEFSVQVKLPALATTGLQAAQIVEAELTAATEAALIDLQGQVTKRTPVNFGLLRRAWSREVYSLGSNAQVLGRVFNPLSYALPAETGRKPGKWPPFAPIALWVKRVLRPPMNKLASLTFLMRRKIGRDGTKGAWMARDGWAAALPAVRGRFRVALRRINGKLRGAK
jgi:hypothetical protein